MPSSFADPPYTSGDPQSSDETRDVRVNLDADVSQYRANVTAAQQDTDRLNASIGQLASNVDSLSKRAGRRLIHIGVADAAGLTAAAADAATLEKQLSTLRATSVVTGTSMSATKRQIDDVFSSFPVYRRDVIALTQAVANLGITQPQAIGANVKTFTRLGAATGESPVGLASGGIQLSRQMGTLDDPTRLAKYANSLLTVSKNQGVAAQSVLEFSQAIAPMAREAGIGEAAVLGISAAFQKAGADGFYAANTFGQIISTVNQLSRTNNPQLARFSSFLGMDMGQFRSMSGTEQFTQLFEGLAKGGPEAQTFLQSLGFGQRALTSIQAVAQSGSMRAAIGQAQAAANGTGNLDAASKAAFSGLSNSVTDLRNQFTRLGDKIGDPLLKPLELATRGATLFAQGVNSIVDHMGPMATVMAVAGGVGATAGGFALGNAGLIGTLALGRTVFGRNSRLRQGLAAGREVGAAMAGGMSEAEALGLNPLGQTYAAGQAARAAGERSDMLLRSQIPFMMGMQMGQRSATGAAGGAGGIFGRAFGAARRGGLTLGAYLVEEQNRTLRESSSGPRTASRSEVRGERRRGRRSRGRGLGRLARAGGRFVTENTFAAGSMAAGMAGAAMRAGDPGLLRRGAAGAGFLAGRGAGLLARGAGALFSPAGLLATTVGLPMISTGIGYLQDQAHKPIERADDALNSVTKYDQMLDKSSSNLARFGDSVTDAADRLSKFANSPLGQVAGVTGADISAATANPTLTDAGWTGVAAAPNSRAAAMAYLQSLTVAHGGMTGDYLTAIKQDMLRAFGVNRAADVGGSLSSFVATNPNDVKSSTGIDFSALGTGAAGQDNTNFANLISGAVTGIASGTQDREGGNRARLAAMLNLGAGALGGAYSSDNAKSFGETMSKMFGGAPSDYVPRIINPSQIAPSFGTPDRVRSMLATRFAASDNGKQFLKSIGIDPTADDVVPQILALAGGATGLPAASTAGSFTELAKKGPLGGLLAGNNDVQSAVVSGSGSANTWFKAITGMTDSAVKTGGDLTEASGALMHLSDQMGGADDATGGLLLAASKWARTLESFQLPTLTRAGQLAQSSQQFNASRRAFGANASPDTLAQMQEDQGAFEQQKESYRQFMISRTQQLKQFTLEQERAAEDRRIQLERGERDFRIQMQRGDQNYAISRLRSQQEFEISSTRSREDFQRQTARSTEDFQRQMKRQADHAAESIYDPFARTQAKATASAGTLLFNLESQNTDISQQVSQIKQVQSMGLSKQAVDTLRLTSADNAQQLNRLVGSLQDDPNLVGRINKAVSQRVSGTEQLVEFSGARDVQEQIDDFQRSMDRATTDFHTSESRATADHTRSLNQMAQDFARTRGQMVSDHERALSDLGDDVTRLNKRAADDLTESFREYAGGFDDIFGGLVDVAAGKLSRYAPQAANTVLQELARIREEEPWIAYQGPTDFPTGDSWNRGGSAGRPAPVRGLGHTTAYADGGISLTDQLARVSENGPELHLPLNARGEDFLSGLIARSLAKGITMAIPASAAAPQVMSSDHSISFAGAEISVVAQDPNRMARELAAKAKLKRLVSPNRR